MQPSALTAFGVDIQLLQSFLESTIEESKSILEATNKLYSHSDWIHRRLLIANAELFLLLLQE